MKITEDYIFGKYHVFFVIVFLSEKYINIAIKSLRLQQWVTIISHTHSDVNVGGFGFQTFAEVDKIRFTCKYGPVFQN